MILRKWNCRTHKYEDYEIPDKWKVSLMESDMNVMVNCPHCGKKIRFGETYTSRQFHNWVGLGLGVCEKCYEKEWEEEREAKKDENGNDY